jgi:hypothetical protein
MRVEFKTDALNVASRVYFSIVDTEWPAVKARLASKLDFHGADQA